MGPPEQRTSHDEGATCRCVVEHRPPVLEYERHHVLPIYLGGDSNGETVWVCPSTHANCHELLRLMLSTGRTLTDFELQTIEDRPVSRYAAVLARDGFNRWRALIPTDHPESTHHREQRMSLGGQPR